MEDSFSCQSAQTFCDQLRKEATQTKKERLSALPKLFHFWPLGKAGGSGRPPCSYITGDTFYMFCSACMDMIGRMKDDKQWMWTEP